MKIELLTIAATSGIFAGISSCALPLYPAMLNRLTQSKENPKIAALMFTLGLALVYFTMYLVIGTLAAFFGTQFIGEAESFRRYFMLFAALFSWFLAWITIKGDIIIGTRQILRPYLGNGYFSAIASGFVYGTVVTSCSAPFLFTGILPALSSRGSVLEGAILLLTFAVSMALPLILLGWVSGFALTAIKVVNDNRKLIEKLSAVFLILTGFYYIYLFYILSPVG